MPLEEARRNDEVITLADSLMLRWIDELNGVTDTDERFRDVKHRIEELRNSGGVDARREIVQLCDALDHIQYKPDYMCLIIDKEKDYYRACNGFTINGIKYRRLLGTNGGIKNSTIVFVNEKLVEELRRRIDNDRDLNKPLVTAKLEAYKALTCSASNPVSLPRGILIVNDAFTNFVSDTIFMTDENVNEPIMELRKDQPIEMDATDGCGIMLPSLADRWSKELGLNYTVSGVNTRFSFEKGMVFTFDFIDFAERVANQYIVKDAWGNDVDIRNIELILTTSMVKLWDSYDSCDDYVSKSISNGYTFGIAKTCPRHLESERSLNYQFIQSYNLSDEDIEELIAPTREEILDVLSGDWRKTLLFLNGTDISADKFDRMTDDYSKAIMVDRRVMNDPYVQSSVQQLIQNRINEAKVGVIKVHGNYSIVSGDPYLLCQSIFGMPTTGLLHAGEIYNQFWSDCGSEKLVCFRAPMTCHNNIRLVYPVDRPDARYWYRYMNACTIFNAFDTATAALNGMDYDGDLVMLTDNRVLIDNLVPMPALMCAQRKAEKRVSDEEDFIKSNIESFGNDIGQTTNWITSMYEVQAGFEPGSKEYEILDYRIKCGQLYQQNAIDRSKGIIAKPMPRSWHDKYAIAGEAAEEDRELYRSIVADKKPYFMRYIYPNLMKQYNTYIKNTNRNAMREFQMTISDLLAIPDEDRTDRQREFIKYYKLKMPVGTNDCVMNRICKAFEKAFDGYVWRRPQNKFDYTILKSGAEYSARQYRAIMNYYEEYNKRLGSYSMFAEYERIDQAVHAATVYEMNEDFKKECAKICPDRFALCDILLDICYKKNATKRFVWNMCGTEIIHNLLVLNENRISYPVTNNNGEIYYGGYKFSVETTLYRGE